MTSFMDFYHGHGQRLNKELFTAKEKIKEMEDEIKMIDDRLSELAPLGQTGETSYDDKYVHPGDTLAQGRRKHLKLGGHDAARALFSLRKGAFSKIKRALLCLLQNLGGTCPQCPLVPTSVLLFALVVNTFLSAILKNWGKHSLQTK